LEKVVEIGESAEVDGYKLTLYEMRSNIGTASAWEFSSPDPDDCDINDLLSLVSAPAYSWKNLPSSTRDGSLALTRPWTP
jgi:hypothetical protein